jgi:hypothetical protein
MKQASLITHLMLLTVAVMIGYVYIYPTVLAIGVNQDTAVMFNNEIPKVKEFNSQLEQKLMVINSIPFEERQKLSIYMPLSFDELALLRTFEAIMLSVGIEPSALEFERGETDASAASSQDGKANIPYTIVANVSASFVAREEVVMNFLDAVALSTVPFVLETLELTPTEDGRVTVEVMYSTYALAPDATREAVSDSQMLSAGMNF